MADEITNRSFSKYSPFFSNFPKARVKSRATIGFSAMTSVLPNCKVRLVRFPNSDRDSKGQPNRWQLIYCWQTSVAATVPLEPFTLPDLKTRLEFWRQRSFTKNFPGSCRTSRRISSCSRAALTAHAVRPDASIIVPIKVSVEPIDLDTIQR